MKFLVGIIQTQQFPSWIKNNAKWCANAPINNNDFVKDMQYIITQRKTKISD